MDPEEFEAWLMTLPPEEQEAALYEYGFAQANQVPGSFGGGYPSAMSPELGRGSYDLLSMQQLPPDIEYGDVQPFGLDEYAQANNALQDLGALSLDPAIRMYAGRGAFAPGAFDPTTIPVGEPLDMAGARYVDMLANSGPGYESYLAQKIKPVAMGGAGMSPGQAVATMWADIANPDPAMAGLRDQLVASLPPPPSFSSTGQPLPPTQAALVGDLTTPQGQAATTDVFGISETARDMFERIASDPIAGYTDPSGMQFAGSYEQPSEIAEKFAEYGLPSPEASYMDPEYLPPVNQEYQAAKAQAMTDLTGRLDEATAVRDQTTGNMEQMVKAWREAQAAPAGPPKVGDDPNNPYGLSSDDLRAAEKSVPTNIGTWVGSSNAPPEIGSFRDEARAEVGLAPINTNPGYSIPQSVATGGLLDLQNPSADTGTYDQAYAEWEEEQRKRLESEAQRRTATANQGSGNPFVVSSGDRVLDTYNFAGTPEQQAGYGSFVDLWSQLRGGPDVSVSQLAQNPRRSYAPAVQAAENQWGQAYQAAEQLRNYTTPDEASRARAIGLAAAMESYGRTPLQDVLMQGALGRQALMPGGY